MKALAPVSRETLAAVPWAGVSRLTSLMEEVLARGPHDTKTWSNLLKRLEIIAPSFGHRHLSRVLVTIGKSGKCNRELIEKLRYHSLDRVAESDILSCCGILYGMHKLGRCDKELIDSYKRQVENTLGTATGPYPLVVLATIFSCVGETETTQLLLRSLLKWKDELNPKALSMVVVSTVSHFGNDPRVMELLTPMMLQATARLQEMDTKSMTQMYCAIAKSSLERRVHYMDEMAEAMLPIVDRLSFDQASAVLSNLSRSRHFHSRLITDLTKCMQHNLHKTSAQQLLAVLAALLRLGMRDSELVNILIEKLSQQQLGATELANLIYVTGKWKLEDVHIDQLVEKIQGVPENLSPRDVALIAYGFSKMGNIAQLCSILRLSEEVLKKHEGPIDPRVLAMIKHAEDSFKSYSERSTNSFSPL